MNLRERLAQDLREAMKARDGVGIAALRTLSAALDNATAVPVPPRAAPMPAASVEVPRKELTDDDIRSIVQREISERQDAAFVFEMHGCFEEALALEAQIGIIERYLTDADG